MGKKWQNSVHVVIECPLIHIIFDIAPYQERNVHNWRPILGKEGESKKNPIMGRGRLVKNVRKISDAIYERSLVKMCKITSFEIIWFTPVWNPRYSGN